MPSEPARNGWVSSAVPRGLAGPTAATEEVKTTLSTSAARLSSRTIRVPFTFRSNTLSRFWGRIEVLPAM